MKKILGIVFLVFLLSTNAHSDNIKDFKIENISIGDSALDYFNETELENGELDCCLLYTSPSPRDGLLSRMPSSA